MKIPGPFMVSSGVVGNPMGTKHKNRLFALTVDLTAELVDGALAALFEAGFEGVEERKGPQLRVYGARSQLETIAHQLAAHPWGERVEIRIAPHDDARWATRWMDHLEPVQLTPRWRVLPAEADVRPTAHTIVLEKRLAFGFGDHPTTALAARAIERIAHESAPAAMLDVGTGTGILSIVAARSGVAHVLGIDTEASAIDAARANAALNDVGRACSFRVGEVHDVRDGFDLVVANVDARVLVAAAGDLGRAARSHLVVTGFVVERSPDVEAALGATGLSLESRDQDGEWALLAYRSPHRVSGPMGPSS